MIGLIDCNNFYASCERVFNPKLEGRPVGILSNNDGCVIARSNEIKPLVPIVEGRTVNLICWMSYLVLSYDS
uniref:Y-family DNA polymerase n=1 Tax=Entomomonas moraniae TaxID=2213226 RepID=UPI0026A7BDDE|nr:hypothetical protein [Entomomonas moraniae]